MATKTKKRTAIEVMGEIQSNAEKTAGHRTDFVRVLGEKQLVRQGDVAVTLAPKGMQLGAVRGSRQVALGTSIGSRHVAEGDVVVHERPGAGMLEGPVVVAKERWTLTHPEHAHKSLPAGTYAIEYQRDLSTERAVQD